jgi:glycosyltransferase involved in cell wall biosynthesis
MRKTISLLGVIRDAEIQGYPLIESLLCVFPIVDEVLISDGGSVDGTIESLERLKEAFPDMPLKIYHIPDYPSTRWDCCSDAMNVLIDDSVGEWVFSSHADEIIHEEDLMDLQDAINNEAEANCFRQPRKEIRVNWKGMCDYDYGVVRAARRIPGLYQDWNAYGGDEFIRRGKRHTLQPEKTFDRILYHVYALFPDNLLAKRKRDAEYLAPSDKMRWQIYEDNKQRIEGIRQRPITPLSEIYSGIPAIVKDLSQMRSYRVRDELFDLDWLRETTGLNYG